MPNVFNVNGVESGAEPVGASMVGSVNPPSSSIGQPQDNPPFQLQRTQKIALVLISVIGIGVLALGIVQSKNILNTPFGSTAADRAQAAATTALAPAPAVNTDAELKKKDTDADGINDFDELNVYDTSPYLADSDSDGISDADEIKNGTDPTCPQGQQCFRSAVVANSANTGDANSANTSDANNANTGDANLANITPAQLRQLIVKSGQLTQEEADQIDDQTLLDTYKEALAKNPAAATTDKATPPATTDPTSVADLKNYTAAQIKQLLIEQGMDPAGMVGVDDATLKQLYIEALDKVQQAAKATP